MGGKAELKCRVESTIQDYINPNGQGRSYKWFKVGNEDDSESLSNTDKLKINEFTPNNEGDYGCIVTFKRSWNRWVRHQKVSSPYTLKIKGEYMSIIIIMYVILVRTIDSLI